MLTRVWIAALAALLALPGCFSVDHRLPPNTYFGKLPAQSGERSSSFEGKAMKNWALAGFFPYSPWSTRDLLQQRARRDVVRVENAAVETVFGPLDVFISIIPGLFYGYYVWAPRTVRVTGTEVRRER